MVDFAAQQAAARRLGLEDIAADVIELNRHAAAVGGERRGHIQGRIADTDGVRLCRLAHLLNRRTRYAHADRHLRTDSDELEYLRERTGDVGIMFMIAVVTHPFAEQTGADPDTNFVMLCCGSGKSHASSPMGRRGAAVAATLPERSCRSIRGDEGKQTTQKKQTRKTNGAQR